MKKNDEKKIKKMKTRLRKNESLEMYIFHFEAISMSIDISGSKRPIFTNIDSLERPWLIDGS
jgi:hypothetical protein